MQINEDEIRPKEANGVDASQWVNKYADYLYSYAVARLNDEEQARDLVQETFLGALERIDKFEGRSSERTWLTAILKNKIMDVYRKRASRLGRRTEAPIESYEQHEFFYAENGHWREEHWPKAFGIEEYDPLSAKEFQHVLKKCMQKLPSLWLSVFTMKHIDDEKTEMICSELNVTPANFWVIIHRTKLNLRSCLQQNWI